MEALWMLAGRNDVEFPQIFNSKFGQYSDDGHTFNGAYGYRWRRHFNHDQITLALHMLRTDPTSRRVVISMWDGHKDLGAVSKDIPCNLQILPRVWGGSLNLTVFNRSNDLIWGALGSNVVHFSILQELMAYDLELEVGAMYQVTNNLHIYDNVPNREIYDKPLLDSDNSLVQYPIISTPLPLWMKDVEGFVRDRLNRDWNDPFFRHVAAPMAWAWHMWKGGDKESALMEVDLIKDQHWQLACRTWMENRLAAREKT
jgi:hypothetical protein